MPSGPGAEEAEEEEGGTAAGDDAGDLGGEVGEGSGVVGGLPQLVRKAPVVDRVPAPPALPPLPHLQFCTPVTLHSGPWHSP